MVGRRENSWGYGIWKDSGGLLQGEVSSQDVGAWEQQRTFDGNFIEPNFISAQRMITLYSSPWRKWGTFMGNDLPITVSV